MITIIFGGLIFLALLAIVVGMVDAATASTWRRVAAERRERWETRQLMLHGFDEHHHYDESPDWDDD